MTEAVSRRRSVIDVRSSGSTSREPLSVRKPAYRKRGRKLIASALAVLMALFLAFPNAAVLAYAVDESREETALTEQLSNARSLLRLFTSKMNLMSLSDGLLAANTPEAEPATIVDSGTCGEAVTWTLYDTGELVIEGTGTMADYATSPAAPWHKHKGVVSSVVISDGVTSVATQAFREYVALTSATIPSSVATIGNYAFAACTNLASITIPSGVDTIGNMAFQDCTSLTSVTIPSSVKSMGSSVFSGCTNLTSAEISSGVASIGTGAFVDCTNLASIVIPSSVASIGSYAFMDCTSLTSAEISSGVASIGTGAFEGCTNLASITIPSTVETIGNNAFNGCASLVSVTIPSSVTSIGLQAFSGCKGPLYCGVPSQPDGWASGEYRWDKDYTGAIYWAQGGEPNVVIKNKSNLFGGVLHISGSGFTHPTDTEAGSIIAVKINGEAYSHTANSNPETDLSVWSIIEATAGGYFEADITLPDGTADGAGGSTPALVAGDYTLQFLTGSLKAGDTPRSIESNSFSVAQGDHSGFCGGESVTWTLNTTTGLLAIEGSGAMSWTGSPPWYDYRDAVRKVVISSGVTEIGNNAFNGCVNLVSVSIPEGVVKIGVYAFSGCETLSSVDMPSSVASIGSYAFQKCSSLVEVNIPAGVDKIGDLLFSDCTALVSVTIPPSVTSIGKFAFSGCPELASLTIPSSVASVANKAFSGIKGPLYCEAPSQPIGWVSTWNGSYTGEILWDQGEDPQEPEPSGSCGENTVWAINTVTGVLSIAGSGSMEWEENPPWQAYGDAIGAVYISSGVTTVGSRAFAEDYVNLVSVTIPSTVTIIEEAAFAGCTGITSISIPSSVETIGDSAFSGCISLVSINLFAGVETIGAHAFANCTSLASITIPSTISTIEDIAFGGCTNLASVVIPSTVTTIGSAVFSGCAGPLDCDVPALPEGWAVDWDSGYTGQINWDETTPPLSPPSDPTITIAESSITFGTILHVSGTGFTHPEGGGSVIAVKIDDYGYNHTAASGGSNTWAVIEAEGDGSFEAEVLLPDGTDEGIAGSTPAFTEGAHWLRFLTGSLKAGDSVRTLKVDFTVVAPTEPPTTTVPVVTAHPTSVLLQPGDTFATFTATAAETASVRWQSSDDNGGSWADIDGAAYATLRIPASTAKDGTVYRAVFTNAAGSTETSAATLYVVPVEGYEKVETSYSGVVWYAPTTVEEGGEAVLYGTGFTHPDGRGSGIVMKFDDTVQQVAVYAEVATGVWRGTYTLPTTWTAGSENHWFRLLTGSTLPGDVIRTTRAPNVTIVAATEPPQPSAPTITLDKATYQPGDTVTVSGVGFTPDSTIRLAVPGPGADFAPSLFYSAQTDSDGAFSVTSTATVLDTHITGDHLLMAWDGPSQSGEPAATAVLSIETSTPRAPALSQRQDVTWNPGQVAPFTGFYFDANTQVTASINGETVEVAPVANSFWGQTTTSNAAGSFNVGVSIPTINGDYELTFTVGDSTYTHRFNVTAGTPPQPVGPTVTVAHEAELGGSIHIFGTGFTHPTDTAEGSTIAVKIDDGAYSHISGYGPNANLSVWAIVQAAADGTFEADITLPDGTGEGANGSTPAFTTGSHTLRLLTGSLKLGDTIRTLQSESFAVTEASTPPSTVVDSGTWASTDDPEGITWALDSEGTLTIAGAGDMAFVYGTAYPWSQYGVNITSLVIQDGVTSVGPYAFFPPMFGFAACDNLTSISIPASVKTIDVAAFRGCPVLTSITIPEGVTTLGTNAFYQCTALASVTLPSALAVSGGAVFVGCTSLTSVTIPEGVTTLGMSMFSGCTALASVMLPSTLETIGSGTFDGCTALTTIEIPSGVKVVESNAFSGCTALTTIDIPSTVVEIQSYAFYNCTSLASVTIPVSVATLGARAFGGVSGDLYCEATEQPDDWDENWANGFTGTIYWGQSNPDPTTPTVTLDKASYQPGDTVTVSGVGFTSDSTIRLAVPGPGADFAPSLFYSAQTDSDGAFSVTSTATVLDTHITGDHLLMAWDGPSQSGEPAATAVLSIETSTPRAPALSQRQDVTWNPGQVAPFTGFYFDANTQVTASINGEAVEVAPVANSFWGQTTTSNAAGSFNVGVSIPTINGDYELTFTVGDSTYTHRFNVTAGTPPQPPDPAITVAASAELGGVLHLSGVGFTHPDGSGSTIAVKIDDGAYSHISGEGPNANLSVWAIVQAAADGTFEADITLPDGTGEGANGSTPAFTTGSHTLRLLTGSLKAGDTIRTVASDSFTVTPPAGTPTVTVTPSVELGGVLHVSGTNFTHPTDTEAGSLIALKLDGGAYAHTAGNGVDANLTVWALVQAAADGSFEYDLTLPDGTTEGANGSVPAFPVGDHSMNFLSGTMKQGDTIRSLAADFTVTAASTPPPVGTAPAITTQPLSQSVTVGTAVSFNAAASGDPTPSVQWYVKAAGQSTFADVPDATSATLELGAVTLAQSGSEYKVTFTNDNGIATSEVATLTVIEESTPPPADETTVTVTTEATLGGTVQITGTGWAHPDGTGSVVAVKIDDGAYSHTTGNGPNANLSVWAIIEANDDGTFEADVTLPDGTEAGAAGSTPAFATGEHTLRFLSGSLKTGDVIRTLQSVVITVTDGSTPPPTGTVPVITTQPVSQTVTAGATATFIAAATGNPAPSVKWQYYTGAIWADIVNATSPTLSVTNANVTFSGRQYRAVFTNSEGTATSDVVTLTVTEGTTPPPIGDAAVTIGATASVGGSIHISGTGFTHPDGTGSTVAIKINEGAFSRTAEGKVNDNLSVWAIVNANADGSFEYDLVLPDGTEAGAGGSTPAFREGEYTLRFLTGSLKAGDTIRTVQSTPFIVGQYRPVGDPTPIDPSASLTGALSDLISISITGNQAVITIPSAEPGDWVHLSAYLGSSVRYPWGAGANFVVDTNRQVRVTLAAGAFEESGTYSVVVRDVSQGAGAAVLGWASYLVPDPDDGSGNDGDGSGNGSGNGSGGDSIVNNYYNTTNSGGGGSTASTTTTTPSTGTTTTGTGTGTSATTGTNATTGTGTGSGSTTGTGSSTGTSSGSNAGSSNLSDQATPLADGTTAAEDSFTLLLNIILIAAAALVAAIAVAACILVYRSRRPSAGN